MSNGRKSNSPRQRLDVELVKRRLVDTRSQAENYIKLGRVRVDNKTQQKAGWQVSSSSKIELSGDKYVSRAALKLASVADKLQIKFNNQVVLDVGSSTGGFSDYALQNGAKKVIAVDVGTDQLHPKLRADKRIELHEKTDIRDFKTKLKLNIVLIDVSFISLRHILPAVSNLSDKDTFVIAMVKPQFEVGDEKKHKGVIKNDSIRRDILKSFEIWAKQNFSIVDKADAEITGAKGNRERFYKLVVKR